MKEKLYKQTGKKQKELLESINREGVLLYEKI